MLDQIKLQLVAGKGGHGKISFFQDWHQPRPQPDGGNGGNGGNIVFIANARLKILNSSQHLLRASDGVNGKSKNCHGKNGADLIYNVPVGTLLWTVDRQFLLCDFTQDEQIFVVVYGGAGGHGNAAFLSNFNRYPRQAEPGMVGETKEIFLELKMLAHVGLFGLPNAGKSSLLKAITHAQPKIGNYAFTTLQPNLGVLKNELIISDLPGIIEGASKNRGLGNRFLKHAERCLLLLFLVDLSDTIINIQQNFHILLNELINYNKHFLKLPIIIVGNKIDLPIAQQNLVKFQQFLTKKYSQYSSIIISALRGNNLSALETKIVEVYKKTSANDTVLFRTLQEKPTQILYQYKIHQDIRLQKLRNNTWLLSGKLIENLFKHYDLKNLIDLKRFNQRLKILGIDQILKHHNVKDGDIIFANKQTFTWKFLD